VKFILNQIFKSTQKLVKSSITKHKYFYKYIVVSLLFLPNQTSAQAINLATMTNFVCFSAAGAISNTGNSEYTGDIGTGSGIISGFGTSSVNGTFSNNDAVTNQGKSDLLNLYILLSNIPVNNYSHTPAFGNGEIISAGVYSISGAGSLGGQITLDGNGNADAFFIIKFQGAFTAGASSSIILANGTQSCNVFWIAEGAISVGVSSSIKGTIMAHSGAITLAAGSTLEGRLLSSSGAITFGPGTAVKPLGISSIQITCLPTCPIPILGTVANFALFTSAGACANDGISGFIGNVGTDLGAISGFESSVIVGEQHAANATTAQATIDLQSAYTQLMNTPTTNTAHAPAFGSGETITAGVYGIAGAGSLAGILILDGQGNPNATFIFKFGGAFATAAQSKVLLINGANRCKIFWVAEGAISMGTFSFMKGTLIAHNGANTIGANGNIEGRMLSTAGAIGFSAGVAYTSYFCNPNSLALPIELLSFTSECNQENLLLKWSTATERNNEYFTIEHSLDGINWKLLTTVAGAGNSNELINYSFSPLGIKEEVSYCRLKQTDYDGQFKYSEIIVLNNCGANVPELSVYPNPASETLNLTFSGDKSKIVSISIYNIFGEMIYFSNTYQSKITLDKKYNGIYFLHLNLDSQKIIKKFVAAN